MPAPTVNGRLAGEDNTAGFSFTPTWPAGITVGELLYTVCSGDDNPVMDIGGGSDPGWTRLIDNSAGGAADPSAATFWKQANGSDTLVVSASTSQRFSWVSFRIGGWDSAFAPVALDAGPTSSTNANPPSLTTGWGAVPVLWIVSGHWDGTITPSAAPTNYSNLTGAAATDPANGVSTWSAERTLTAATEDPGSFTSATEQWIAITTGIRGLTGGNPPRRSGFRKRLPLLVR